tara:strand:- start:4476 stop:5309 length:834 start_codon:yes stop_codon:yes gene_type:complete
MQTSSQLTIITVSYNSQKILTQCLAPLIESGKYPVIIIDNASPDDSESVLKHRFPRAKTIALKQNIGYGRAANVGLEMVETPYALLINPDLKAGVEDIQQLLNHALTDSSQTAIWGPASEKKDNTGASPQAVKWISGCAMLFEMDKLRKIGLFDENIFLFFEETDLCERAQAMGFTVKQCNDVYFEHLLGQASTPSPTIEQLKNWHFGWSSAYFHAKHKLLSKKTNPTRRLFTYRRKSIFNLNSTSRIKYKNRANGIRAFLNGEKAFDRQGLPAGSK